MGAMDHPPSRPLRWDRRDEPWRPAGGALAYQVSAWRKRDTISERGKRGKWEKFDRVMAKVRDVPPLPGEEK